MLQEEDTRTERCWEERRHVGRPGQRGRGRAVVRAGEGGGVADRQASRVSERRARVGLEALACWVCAEAGPSTGEHGRRAGKRKEARSRARCGVELGRADWVEPSGKRRGAGWASSWGWARFWFWVSFSFLFPFLYSFAYFKPN